MSALLIIWMAWTIGATLLGLVIGLVISEADRIEQPEPETAELHVPHEWVA